MLFNFLHVLPNMIVILIITMIMMVNCLEPKLHNDIDDEIKTIIGKYISKIPDIKPRYVINDALSKVINHYFKGKISTLPLYKISLTIDRNPVKIPWTLDAVEDQQRENVIQRALDEQLDKNVKQRYYKVLKSSVTGITGITGMTTTRIPDTTVTSSTTSTTATPSTTSTTTPSTTPPPLTEIQ